MPTYKVDGLSVPKIEWTRTDRQTDKTDCITSSANAVDNDKKQQLTARVQNVRSRKSPLTYSMH